MNISQQFQDSTLVQAGSHVRQRVRSLRQMMKNLRCGSWHHSQWWHHGGFWTGTSEARFAWFQIPALSSPLCLTLGKLPNLSLPWPPLIYRVRLAAVPLQKGCGSMIPMKRLEQRLILVTTATPQAIMLMLLSAYHSSKQFFRNNCQ